MKEIFEKSYIYEDEETQIYVIADGKTVALSVPALQTKGAVEVYPVLEDTLENRKKYRDMAIILTAERRKG